MKSYKNIKFLLSVGVAIIVLGILQVVLSTSVKANNGGNKYQCVVFVKNKCYYGEASEPGTYYDQKVCKPNGINAVYNRPCPSPNVPVSVRVVDQHGKPLNQWYLKHYPIAVSMTVEQLPSVFTVKNVDKNGNATFYQFGEPGPLGWLSNTLVLTPVQEAYYNFSPSSIVTQPGDGTCGNSKSFISSYRLPCTFKVTPRVGLPRPTSIPTPYFRNGHKYQ